MSAQTERRVLAEVWTLTAPGPNGVAEDVEGICRGVIDEMCSRLGVELEEVDWDDSLNALLAAAVVLHRSYDPAKRNGTGSFEGYLYDRLRFRLVDHWRSPAGFGRRGQFRVFDPRVLGPTVDDNDAGEDRLDEPADRAAEDAFDARLGSCGGLLTLGDREEARPDGERGREADLGSRGGAALGNGRARATAASAGRVATSAYVDCLACGWRTYRQAPNGMPGWHWPERCASCGAALKVAA